METSGILNRYAKVWKNWEKLAHFQCVRRARYWAANGASSGRDSGWGSDDSGKTGPGVGVAASDERPGVGAGAPRVERRDIGRACLLELSGFRHGLGVCSLFGRNIYGRLRVKRSSQEHYADSKHSLRGFRTERRGRRAEGVGRRGARRPPVDRLSPRATLIRPLPTSSNSANARASQRPLCPLPLLSTSITLMRCCLYS